MSGGSCPSLLVVVVLLSACASASDRARTRFASEFSCPESQVAVRQQGANVYAASGCDVEAEYVCKSFVTGSSDKEQTCERRGIQRKDPGPPAAPQRQDLVPPK